MYKLGDLSQDHLSALARAGRARHGRAGASVSATWRVPARRSRRSGRLDAARARCASGSSRPRARRRSARASAAPPGREDDRARTPIATRAGHQRGACERRASAVGNESRAIACHLIAPRNTMSQSPGESVVGWTGVQISSCSNVQRGRRPRRCQAQLVGARSCGWRYWNPPRCRRS